MPDPVRVRSQAQSAPTQSRSRRSGMVSQLLPIAKAGGARLADFTKRPPDAALAPTAILNLVSMRLSVAGWTRVSAG